MSYTAFTIIGQIEGHGVLPSDTKTTKYEHVIPQLVAVEEDPRIEGMMIVLNTVGGDVEAGLALCGAYFRHEKTDCVIGARRRTFDRRSACGVGKMLFIVPSATMTIHPCGLTDWSLAFRRRCLIFEKMQKRITDFVVSNSKVTAEKFRSLMMNTDELATDMGSVLDGRLAVECGLIDHIGSLSDVISRLYSMIESEKRRTVMSAKYILFEF